MTEEKKVQTAGRAPDYKGDGVAVWVGKTKEGKQYLNIKILNSFYVAAWQNFENQQVPKKVSDDEIN